MFLSLLLCLVGYIFGSIPTAYLITKYKANIDIRNVGSGNVGATNVLRTIGKKWGLVTFLSDFFKSFVPILILDIYFNVSDLNIALFSIACILGHIFPIWIKFKGGKGVATAFGILLAIDFQVGLMSLATWIMIFAFYKISSLSSIIAISMSSFYIYFFADKTSFINFSILIISFIVIAKHSKNIKSLIKGSEKKIL
jgi:glycerol-3-phosphate acyltransferase PlsY